MKRVLSVLLLVAVLALPVPLAAADVNWGSVQSHRVKLFYPGVASWEFVNSNDHGVGRVPVSKRKKACPECHINKEGNLDVKAAEIVNGSLSMKATKKAFEPSPVDGKPGFLDADLQAAYDGENIYLRLQWNSAGKSWTGGDSGVSDRVAIQLNSGQNEFAKYGCFVTCHPGQNSMPDSAGKEKVGSHQYYSKQKREDVRLYAFYTRAEGGGWAEMKDGKEIDQLLKNGGLIDIWEASFRAKGMDVADGWILEDREVDNKDVEGSGEWENGKYTVTLKRRLNTSDIKDVELKEGTAVTIGIAIHDDKAKLRRHYVSYPLSIGLGAEGIVKASKIK